MLNINDTPINKTQNKFLSLRKDLKNEIFEFLEYKEIIFSIRFLNKDNYTFFNNKKIFYYILTNIKTFVEEIGFEEDKLNLIKIKLSQFVECKNHLDNIFIFLLGSKLQNEKKISITKKSLNFKFFYNFLEFRNDLIEIKLISIDNISSDENNMKYLSEGISKLSNLKIIDLSRNNLGNNENNFKYLCQSISKLSNLQQINLWRNKICENENNIKYLIEGLSNHSNLQDLDLSFNTIGKNENNIFYNFFKI